MQLRSIDCHEFEGQPRDWHLHSTSFGQINLIAGKNAAGKTRILNVINNVAQSLSGTRRAPYKHVKFRIDFTDDPGIEHRYELEFKDSEIKRERYVVDNKILVDRKESGEGQIRAEEIGKWMSFQAPATELAAVNRRDKIQHPFFENLFDWARSVSHFSFATNQERTTLLAISANKEKKTSEVSQPENAGAILRKALEEHEREFKELLFEDLRKLDYHCEDVGLDVPDDLVAMGGSPPLGIYLKEHDLGSRTSQLNMSDGMFRALSLLIRLNYAVLTKKRACILVDDVGEGLDFSRSKNLIPLLIDKAKNHGFQLIMTTNDVFVMNSVPLDYWSVVSRRGGNVTVINRQTSPKAFDEFKFVGLSNFEFFASEYFRVSESK